MSPSLSACPVRVRPIGLGPLMASPFLPPFPLLGFTARCLQSPHLALFWSFPFLELCGHTHHTHRYRFSSNTTHFFALFDSSCLASLDPPQSQSFISSPFITGNDICPLSVLSVATHSPIISSVRVLFVIYIYILGRLDGFH